MMKSSMFFKLVIKTKDKDKVALNQVEQAART